MLAPTGPPVAMPSLFAAPRAPSELGDAVPDAVMVPSSASKSVANITYAGPTDLEEDTPTFSPMYLIGSFTDRGVTKKQYLNILLPSGVKHKSQYKVHVGEDLDTVVLFVKMPALMGDGVRLFKDTIDSSNYSEEAIRDTLRVSKYNELLSDIGYNPDKPDEPLWWKAVIDLPEVACTNKLLRKKLWYNSESGAHVLSLDILVKDSKYSADEDEAEEC